jgi:hypothetical protein
MRTAVGLLIAGLTLFPASALAQQPSLSNPAFVLRGPPAPVPPAVVSRDANGVIVRGIRMAEPLVFDGRLDDPMYRDIAAISDFVQQEPDEGTPATDRTEVWIGFDDEALYVGARLWESDSSKRVTSDMRRDARNLFNNDHFAVMLDTFYDRRNGYSFWANSQGGMGDNQITNERGETNWNTLWEVKAADFDGGWTIEFRIPFRSIRFKEGSNVWGINFRRHVRWKNELSFLAPVEAAFGRGALTKASRAATLVGIESSASLRNLDIKPYALGSTITNRASTPPISNDGNGEFGVDAKWAISQSFVTDFTYNTDFAQVEDDEQQVNLTRFSLFFPEKRDFFLEGQRLFSSFGGAQTNNSPNRNNRNNITGAPNYTPNLFFSRRIGLENGVVVPIVGGARLVGRVGQFRIGAVSMRTDDAPGAPATEFTVFRGYREVLRRSRIGVIATRRAPRSLADSTTNYVYGADASFKFLTNVEVVGYFAKTDTHGRTGDDTSFKGRYQWNGDRWGITAEHLSVGSDFNPEIGFVRRDAFRRNLGIFRFSPRPTNWRAVRKLYYEVSMDYTTNLGGDLESRDGQAAFKMDLRNGDSWRIKTARTYERLDDPFVVAKSVRVPVDAYSFQQISAVYTFGPQRTISGSATVRHGSFYDGTLNELTWRGRMEFSPQLYGEPTVSWNRVETPWGDGNTNLVSSRLTYTLSPRMFVSALVQYQSRTDSIATNARFRWEYLPGSELFVVYSDGRTTLSRGVPDVENRSFVVKLTRLLQF